MLWDLDPQAASTYILRRRAKIKARVKDLMRGDASTSDLIKETDYPNLDLLPSDFSYRHFDERFGAKRELVVTWQPG